MESTVIDISRRIAPGAAVWPGDPPLELTRICDIGPDGGCRVSRLSCTSHLLTHMDAPAHFVKDGETLDRIPPERFVGPALVVEVEGAAVDEDAVPVAELIAGKNVIFKTRNSREFDGRTFNKDFAYVTPAAARRLVEARVNLVGIDHLSIEQFHLEGHATHLTLLRAGVLILEGLDLSAVAPGWYELVALPLKLAEADGAPTRAVLIRR